MAQGTRPRPQIPAPPNSPPQPSPTQNEVPYGILSEPVRAWARAWEDKKRVGWTDGSPFASLGVLGETPCLMCHVGVAVGMILGRATVRFFACVSVCVTQ